jgi:hypothetical protein
MRLLPLLLPLLPYNLARACLQRTVTWFLRSLLTDAMLSFSFSCRRSTSISCTHKAFLTLCFRMRVFHLFHPQASPATHHHTAMPPCCAHLPYLAQLRGQCADLPGPPPALALP